jgi:hypothetical protein
MDNLQSTMQQMLNADKRRDTFKFLTSLTGLKLNREQVNQRIYLFIFFLIFILFRFLLLVVVNNFLIVIPLQSILVNRKYLLMQITLIFRSLIFQMKFIFIFSHFSVQLIYVKYRMFVKNGIVLLLMIMFGVNVLCMI